MGEIRLYLQCPNESECPHTWIGVRRTCCRVKQRNVTEIWTGQPLSEVYVPLYSEGSQPVGTRATGELRINCVYRRRMPRGKSTTDYRQTQTTTGAAMTVSHS